MTAMSRTKGKAGEREVAGLLRDLLGMDIRRRVRQHDGDSDLLGVPGWSVEVKRRATATTSDIEAWWEQTFAQAVMIGDRPVLLYRLDRRDWRAVWPLAHMLGAVAPNGWGEYSMAIEGSLAAWAAVVREGIK